MGHVLVASLILAAAPPPAMPTNREHLAQHLKAMIEESRAPAEKGLKQFRELANKENFRSLGFDSLEEVALAELGKPLPVLLVRLDELRNYKEKDDPYKLIHPIPKVMYVVQVKGAARCGLEVEKVDGKWEAASFGLAGPSRMHAEALKKQAEKDRATALFIIKVPALNETYLAYQTEKGPKLVHMRRQAEEKDTIEARPAADVFAELVKLAREHDGKPR
jgi:hypothetical protein